MNPARLHDHCLSFAGAEETFPFGPATSVFKVCGKMFALSALGADSLRVSLKCEPELAEALREAQDRKSTRLNSSHANISYAVFCLKKKIISLNSSTFNISVGRELSRRFGCAFRGH